MEVWNSVYNNVRADEQSRKSLPKDETFGMGMRKLWQFSNTMHN